MCASVPTIIRALQGDGSGQEAARAVIAGDTGPGQWVCSAICFDYSRPPLLMNNECIFSQITKGPRTPATSGRDHCHPRAVRNNTYK